MKRKILTSITILFMLILLSSISFATLKTEDATISGDYDAALINVYNTAKDIENARVTFYNTNHNIKFEFLVPEVWVSGDNIMILSWEVLNSINLPESTEKIIVGEFTISGDNINQIKKNIYYENPNFVKINHIEVEQKTTEYSTIATTVDSKENSNDIVFGLLLAAIILLLLIVLLEIIVLSGVLK